jgi:hypothetical protein
MAGKKGHRLLVSFTCKGCGVVFYDNPSQKRIFCNKVCADKYKPKKKKTYLTCAKCGKLFHPISGSLKQKNCSRFCGNRHGRKTHRKTIPTARNAQRLVAYYIEQGRLVRPKICEECKMKKKIEAAHYDYAEPLRVRWLCVSCHRKWDKQNPKGVTYAVKI